MSKQKPTDPSQIVIETPPPIPEEVIAFRRERANALLDSLVISHSMPRPPEHEEEHDDIITG